MTSPASVSGRVLIVFGKNFPARLAQRSYETIVAKTQFRQPIEASGSTFVDIDSLVSPGSIYEAGEFLDELADLSLFDGSRLAAAYTYNGYELWWMHYDSLFFFFSLPYTQYRPLLEYATKFKRVHMYRPPYSSLFSCYMEAYGRKMTVEHEWGLKSPRSLPFGILLQMVLTLVSLPVLIARRTRLFVFIGDKFEKGKDYDFRMKFIYEELRRRNIPFVEFVRGLEPWRVVLAHACTRMRPVVYSEAVAFLGKFVSVISGSRLRDKHRFGIERAHAREGEAVFKHLVSTWFLRRAADDIWGIRLMSFILWAIGSKAAFIPAAMERNFQTVLGCKLNGIPTVGIMHGTASRYTTPYDFMPGFKGSERLSVDCYGVWSEWWKEYYARDSRAYKKEQLHVSGPMRPVISALDRSLSDSSGSGSLRVLFISEQVAEPTEVLPYIRALLATDGIVVTIKFRPHKDGFEEWLFKNEPELLSHAKLHISRATVSDAVDANDVVVGSYSTAALEALLQFKVPVFFRTRKWGDYYRLADSEVTRMLFAESPLELIERCQRSRSISRETLRHLQEQYFGNPHKNGSAWVVDQLSEYVRSSF